MTTTMTRLMAAALAASMVVATAPVARAQGKDIVDTAVAAGSFKTLAAALDKSGVLERTVVYGSPSFLARVKEANPKIKLLPPLYSPAAIEAMARELQPYAFDTEWNLLSPELIAKCHGLGIKVFSDALGDHEKIEEYQKVMDWGIDLIQTDHPLRLFRAIELRQGR